jgi:transcriptional regulator with XRE-family HTH domain
MTSSQPRERRARKAELNAQICQRVREKRLDLGLLQAQVAAHLGLAESTFSRYESGQRSMTAAMLCQIAAYLRLPISMLVPEEFAGGARPTATGPGVPEEELRQIIQALQQHPDLTPAVVGLLETLLADAEQPLVRP